MKKISALFLCTLIASCSSTEDFVRDSEVKGQPVAVTMLYPSTANYAGGVGVLMHFTNTSGKTLKYMEFGLVPFNATGDVVVSSVGGNSLEIIKYTGPHQPGVSTDDFSQTFSGGPIGFNNIWYNESIRCVEIQLAKAIFMDGTIQLLKGAEANQLVVPDARKNCAAGTP